MLLADYLNSKDHNRKILIVGDTARAQALIRMHEKKGSMVRNVRCMTVSQMADVLYRYILSEDGFSEEYELLDRTEATMLFRGILLDNIGTFSYFNAEKMMDFVTAGEIFAKADIVRANGWNGKENDKADRISDLKKLISLYEDRLEADKLMDQTAKERFILEKMKVSADEMRSIFSAEISYLREDMNQLSGIESELLTLLVNASDPEVCLFNGKPSLDNMPDINGKASFYRGYGSFNEASYVACDILEKKHSFGDVTVLYSSSGQLSAISAALAGNGIPMRIVSDHPVTDNPYISLAGRIVSWAMSGYSERAMDDILLSPVICVKTDDGTGEMENALSGKKYYDHVLNARNRRDDGFVLGWGYERNREFVDHELKAVSTDAEKEVLNMHSELLGIFGENGKPYDEKNKVRPIDLYGKLLAFVEKYTVKGVDYAPAIDGLRRIGGAVGFEERSLPLSEAAQFIMDRLSGFSIKDPEDSKSVKVQSMSSWCALDRKNVYMTGLALKDMQGDTDESPVLTDHEMENYLSAGFVPTIKNKAAMKEKNILTTLATFAGESIVFGYSDYDTVGFCENNASSFFRDALNQFTGESVKNLPEFVYGNPTGVTGSTTVLAHEDRDSYDIRHETSSSTLEVLLDCPKKYAFDKVMHIPDNSFTECDYGSWLDALNRGSFFHSIAEKYCNDRLVRKASEAYETAVDESFVKTVTKDIEEETLLKAPCAFRQLADRETEELADNAIRYLQSLLDELAKSGSWRVLKAEQNFSGASYPIRGFDGSFHEFSFTGYIDRIDYCLDRSAEKCLIRIIDYKTGKKDKKEKEDSLGKLIQYAIYKKALMETGKAEDDSGNEVMLIDLVRNKVAELEEDDSVKAFEFEFDSFQYIFPLDRNGSEPISIEDSGLEGLNLVRLKSILAITASRHVYPDHKELVDLLGSLADDFPADAESIRKLETALTDGFSQETGYCQYCTYKHLCTNRKAGEIG
ncbi:MAG: PD-(D/E)XK nuclease family protein [Lachnospiraceae bacterium]|nr:PD-(D/E)XK nuclease family protein [Lachnospiraceae bacterium]